MATNLGYLAHMDQSIRQTVKYGISLSFPLEEWYCEKQLERADDWSKENPKFQKKTVKEGLPGKGTPELLLSLTPIVELTSVSYNTDAMDPDSLTIIDAEAGIIQSSFGFRGTYFGTPGTIDPHPSSYAQERYFVIYQGGYVLPSWGSSQGDRTLPYDLERAIIDTVKAMVKSGSGGIVWDGVMSSYKIGDTAVSWGNKTSAQSTALDGGVSAYFPPSSLAVLNWYRRAY